MILLLGTCLLNGAQGLLELPHSGIVLSNTSAHGESKAVLLRSDSVWNTRYGRAFTNISGPVVAPALNDLCKTSKLEWAGHIVLGSDWTSPGCSMQARARLLKKAGVLGVVFVGTEGTPFDCIDGSGLVDLPVAVVSWRDYPTMEAIASHNSSVAWITGAATPLKDSAAFQATMRMLQVVGVLLYGMNACFAVKKLQEFGVFSRREEKTEKQAGPAVPVIALNLAATIGYAIQVINWGPTVEAAIEPLFPWFASRMLADLGFELHLVATLLLSAHFRKINAGIQKMVSGGPSSNPRESRRSSTDEEAKPSRWRSGGSKKRRRSSLDMDDLATVKVKSVIPWDLVFMVAVVGLILLQFTCGVLAGLFSLDDFFTLIVVVIMALTLTSLGLWFRYYAKKVINLMKASTGVSQNLLDRIARLSRNVSRVGTCILAFVIVTFIQEVLRQLLLEDGGWVYWGTLVPIWFFYQFILLLSMHFQVRAFQVAGKEPGPRKERPNKIAALESSSDQPMKVAKLANSSEVIHTSNPPPCEA